MRTRIALASAVVAAGSLAPAAFGQLPGFRSGAKPSGSAAPAPAATRGAKPAAAASKPAATPPGPTDPSVVPANVEITAPAFEDDKLGVPLPTVPIEPYLLTKDNGPFMVLAYTFRGPDAPRKALAVVLELRGKHNLPAYILLSKDFPGRSNIRDVPPTAELAQKVPAIGDPEAIRTLDEAAVMVGDEKTVKDSVVLLKKVKGLRLACFNGGNRRLPFHQGRELSRAIRTTNPFVPAELLFAQKPDVLLGQMNGGPHNILNCPGRYSLQVAEFSGRSSFDGEHDQKFTLTGFEKSPLKTAADDAERMAEALNKDRAVQKTGARAYVYHDRFSSRVLIGSFQNPADPSARQVRDQMVHLASDLTVRKVTDVMLAPAPNLTDLTPIKTAIQSGSNAQARK